MSEKGDITVKQLSPIQLQQQIIYYKSELHKYQQKCRELENRTAIKKIAALQNELSSLKTENQTLTRTVNGWKFRYEEANAITEYQAAAIKRLQSDYHQLRLNFNLLKEQYIKRTKIIEISKEKDNQSFIVVSNMQKELQKYEEINIAQQIEIEFLKEEKRLWDKKIITLEMYLSKTELDLYQSDLKAEEENRLYKSDLERIKIENSMLAADLDILENQRKSWTKELQELKEAYIEEKKKGSELKRGLDNEKKMRIELADSLKLFRKKIDQWKEIMKFENTESESKSIDISRSEKEAYETAIKQLQKTNARLVEEINHLKNK
jgi:chromosome segregation ATPase